MKLTKKEITKREEASAAALENLPEETIVELSNNKGDDEDDEK